MFTTLFWKDFAERLVATLAQVAAGLFTADILTTGINWQVWAITLAGAGLGVLAKATAALKISDTVSPASLMPASPDLPAESARDDNAL